LPERVEKLRLDGASLRAVVAGERSDPPGSSLRSVTERRLQMERLEDGAWGARIVLAA
jgi:hypothetical protein